jgi:hypothetical protein
MLILTVSNSTEIPFFGRPEETRKFDSLPSKNGPPAYSSLRDESGEKIDETIQLSTAGDAAA